MFEKILLFVVSILPVFVIGSFIYKKDNYKESNKLLVKLFLGGVVSCVMVLIISVVIMVIFPNFFDFDNTNLFTLFIKVFIGVALVEEGCKWLMAYIISYNNKEFDEFYDMILYCVFVALGFACIENLFYVYSSGLSTGILRALFAVPGHACDGMFMGYYLGLAKIASVNNRKDLKAKNLWFSILIPVAAHGIYDYLLFSGRILFLVIFIGFIIFMYIYAIKKVNHVSSINKKFIVKNKFCPNCGNPVSGNFCSKCGRRNE